MYTMTQIVLKYGELPLREQVSYFNNLPVKTIS